MSLPSGCGGDASARREHVCEHHHNGLLLTPDVVDRMLPFGLNGIKITLDGDRDTHNRMRPLRGGQGTFDRIVENIRQVAGRCRIAIGGNFDESSVDSFPALLDFLKAQDFGDQLIKVNFKPVIRDMAPPVPKGMIPLIPVGAGNKPLNGTCMTSAGAGHGSTCDSCDFLDDKMSFLREETKRHGFRRRTVSTTARAMCTWSTRTPSVPTDRSTHVRALRDSSLPRPVISTTGTTPGAPRRANGSIASIPGKTAETAHSSLCARADASRTRSLSLVT